MRFPIFFQEIKNAKGQLIQAVVWLIFSLFVAYGCTIVLSANTIKNPSLVISATEINNKAIKVFSLNNPIVTLIFIVGVLMMAGAFFVFGVRDKKE
jgi:hypothetical protein